jgi:hypothetical protein
VLEVACGLLEVLVRQPDAFFRAAVHLRALQRLWFGWFQGILGALWGYFGVILR